MKRFTIKRKIAGIIAISVAAIFFPLASLPAFALINASPFALAHEAYQGNFKDRGIPGFDKLFQEYKEGEVTAKDIVRAGVDAGKLSAQTLNNRGYLNAVNSQMRHMIAEH